MALVKAKDFYSNYSDAADDKSDITNFDVYAQGNDKVGSVKDILVDEAEGRIRYLIVDTGTWVFGKKVLLPIGQAQLDYTNKRVIARSLTKEQVENLPNVDDSLDKIDEEHEDQVRGIYRSDRNIEATTATAGAAAGTTAAAFDRSSSRYEQDPDLYNMSDRDHQNLKLYEERLVAHKQRQKTGEVTIGKHVETSTVGVDVPLEKERVVIERTPVNQPAANASADAFKEGEVERVEVYEDTPDIRKETFVREEVQLRKEVDQEVATTNETVRREELDINTEGRPSIDR